MTPGGIQKPETGNDETGTRIDLAADVDRLVEAWIHIEATDTGRHIRRHPSLLLQLRDAVHHPNPGDNPSSRPIPESRPPGTEEPLNLLHTAERAIHALLLTNGIPPRATVEDNLRALAGAALTGPHLTDAAGLVATIRLRAEQALGWAPRNVYPRIRCPECETLGTVAIRMDDHGPRDARCGACGTYWPPEHLGLLGGAV